MREKVSGAMRQLPPDVLPPTVQKADPDSDPVITLAVSGAVPVRQLTEVSDKQIRRATETVYGVGGVDISGGRNRQINVLLDLDKMNAYHLTALDVQEALRSENIESPGGRIVRGPSELGVRTMGRIEHVKEFGNIIVKNVGGSPIRIRDVGTAEDGIAERRTFAYYQNKAAVMLDVRRQTGMNTVKVVDDVRKQLQSLNKQLPRGIQINVVKEQATYIQNSVKAAQFESLAHPFIILLTLPLSIPFALLSLIATGRTLDLFSALGMLLLLGIVKKNGILQIDYMNRLREDGLPLHRAVLEANRVRLRPILMTTFSIVAGLIPTAFGIGAGASQRSAIAVTIIGGQMLCLMLTLLVVPVGYSLVEEAKTLFSRRRAVAHPLQAPASGD